MTYRHLAILLSGLLGFSSLVYAQGESPAPAQPDAAPLSYPNTPQLYQLYLESPAQKVLKLEYIEGNEPIDFELDREGKTVYLRSYYKRGSVRLSVEDPSGKVIELTRSPCYIDPVIPI